MKIQSFAFAALAVGPLVLLAGGCGSSDTGARSTMVEIQPSSYVTIEPVTTTTTIPVPTTIAAGTSAEEQTYTVQGGDSVYKIASLFDIEPDILAAYNSWEDGVGHAIFVGDIVKIPPGASVPGAATASADSGDTGTDTGDTADAGTDDPGTGCTHVIELNENPTKVADRYGITLDELRAANAGNPAMTSFVVGQSLSIPPNGDCG